MPKTINHIKYYVNDHTQQEKWVPVTLQRKHIRNLTVLLDRETLLRHLPSEGVAAEIGVDQGVFSEKILQITHLSVLHLIDTWEGKHGKDAFHCVKKKFKEHRMVQMHQGRSVDAAGLFPDCYFDWIYIDTDHTYRTTKNELESYQMKMNLGGVIAGHDFMVGNFDTLYRYGVVEAVIEFCVRFGWEFLYLTMERHPSYAIRKLNKRININESINNKEMIEHSMKLMRINQKGWDKTKDEPFTI